MGDKFKILLVEDDSFLLQMYATKLDLEGFVVSEATDGDKGIRMAKKVLPDLILLDMLLPKKDGLEVLKELKSDSSTKDIPVIVLSNDGQRERIDKCLALGARDYLIKAHFVPSEVIAHVREVLEKF